MSTPSIKAIDASSIHQITSGQVITDLQTAVKELVENSLDAGATNIEVKFKDYGSQSFEVVDNGRGIAKDDYASIALKGHTSKLETYEGLTSVTSFGFRGEALSSLCQLAEITVTTATEGEPIATILTFDKRGNLISSSGKTARQKGTTVSVSDLFSGIPVRKKEFDRNNRKHFANAQTLLQAYGLISVGTRLTLSNQQDKKPVQVLFRTDGKSLRDNYTTLFSAKSALALLDLDLQLDVEAAARVLKTVGIDELRTKVRVTGLISPPNPSAGRTSGDRQFLFINGRPFESKAIARAFNEVYKNYVPHHMPSFVADFHLDTDAYDVNVSPDKRSIFLHSEQNLIEALKVSLDSFFSPSRATFALDSSNMTRVGRLTAIPATPYTQLAAPQSERAEVETPGNHPVAENSMDALEDTPDDEDLYANLPTPPPDFASGALFRDETPAAEAISTTLTDHPIARQALEHPDRQKLNGHRHREGLYSARESKRARYRRERDGKAQSTLKQFLSQATPVQVIQDDESGSDSSVQEIRSEDIDDMDSQEHFLDDGDSSGLQSYVERPPEDISEQQADIESPNGALDAQEDYQKPSLTAEQALEEHEDSPPSATDVKRAVDHHSSELSFDMDSLRARLRTSRQQHNEQIKRHTAQSDDLENAGIKVKDDDDARKALSRLVSKEDFAKMDIVGQFNLAFIIARRRETLYGTSSEKSQPIGFHDDLMIIDQHASDEKYNFERLQQVTKIDSQRLIRPRVMELPATDELLAMEHDDVLRFNGFEIEMDESAPIGQRIRLVAMPISKSTKKTEFTVEDFEELLFLLRERDGSAMIRPTKTRKLFAMLACRSSIMVGKVLNKSQMSTIVKHMGTIEQPWNCPHGRNTMRWLTGLGERQSDERFRIPSKTFKLAQEV